MSDADLLGLFPPGSRLDVRRQPDGRGLPAGRGRRRVRHAGDGGRRARAAPPGARVPGGLPRPLGPVGRGVRVESVPLQCDPAADERGGPAPRRRRRGRGGHRAGRRRGPGPNGVARQRQDRRGAGARGRQRGRPGGRRQFRRHRPAGTHRRAGPPSGLSGAGGSRDRGRHPCGHGHRACRLEIRPAAGGCARRDRPDPAQPGAALRRRAHPRRLATARCRAAGCGGGAGGRTGQLRGLRLRRRARRALHLRRPPAVGR